MITTGQSSQPIINVQQFVFNTKDSPYESKQDLVKKFSEERNLSAEENFKLMQEVRKRSYASSSLLTVREKDNNTLKNVVDDQVEGSQVRIQMDRIAIPDKINLHKQASEVLYSDHLKSYLNKTKLENKDAKLEEHVKREKEASKGWKF